MFVHLDRTTIASGLLLVWRPLVSVVTVGAMLAAAGSRSFLTAPEAARLIGASHVSIHRWVQSGQLKAAYTPGRHLRIQRAALASFLRSRKLPVPIELRAEARVLVVDDDPTFARALTRGLAAADVRLTVDSATSGLEALIEVGVHKPDVILLDAQMPGVDGIEACRAIKSRKETAGCIVVGFSGRPAEYREAFLKAGAAAFLPKPFTVATVRTLLRELLGERAEATS